MDDFVFSDDGSSAKDSDVYSRFVPHIDSVDFSGEIFDRLVESPKTSQQKEWCKEARDEISFQLLRYEFIMEDGIKKYRVPKYYDDDEFKGLDPLGIEVKIIRDQGRDAYGLDSKYKFPLYIHGLRCMKHLFDKTDITPVLADITKLSFLGFTHGRKYLHLLGSMDAGKSSSTARLAILYMLIDPEYTFGTVSTPLQDSAQQTIYGDLTELYDEICEFHPLKGRVGQKKTSLFPDASIELKGIINFTKSAASGKTGWIATRSMKAEGLGVGSKNKGSDPGRGVGIYIFDEINNVTNFGFGNDLANLEGQSFFQMHTTQNPKDELDRGGIFASPKPWNGWGWGTYDEIRAQNPTIWPTERSGIAYRINGLESVNIKFGKVIYPYQFNKTKLNQTIENYGVSSPEYYAQVLAIFPGADVDVRLLSQSILQQSRHDDEFFEMLQPTKNVLFCDPAHTGHGDNAVIILAEFGKGIVTNTDGTKSQNDLIVIKRPMEYVIRDNLAFWEGAATGDPKNFNDRFAELGGKFNNITPKSPISYEQQIAIRMYEIAREAFVPEANIGYDYSMRPDMVAAVNLIIGFNPIPFEYNKAPIGYHLKSTNVVTTDIKGKFSVIDELAYITADIFKERQIRGGKYIRIACMQLARTKIDRARRGHPIQKKADYKKENSQKSPDERDALMGIVGMAFRHGFRADSNRTNSNQAKNAFQALKKRPKKHLQSAIKKIKM